MDNQNYLYFGDNLDWLQKRGEFPDESVDLIYLDPPFNSKANYNKIFNEPGGAASQAQIRAFDDTWDWEGPSSGDALAMMAKASASDAVLFIEWLARRGDATSKGMAAYLAMMGIRLLELRRVLKPTGSIYLHCDPTASHYLKIIMDCIFGSQQFRNEIVWCYSGGGIPTRDFPRKHDTIFRYAKGLEWTYRHEYRPYNELTAKRMQYIHKGIIVDVERGTPVTDWWTDIKRPTGPRNQERLGYPTQKPEALLERIIQASSNEGDLVLDPFCGCGTTIVAAQKMNRQWKGIDITYLAIDLIEERLKKDLPSSRGTYSVLGSPKDEASARNLMERRPKQFEIWAIHLVGAHAREHDGGVDGLYTLVEGIGKRKVSKVIVQVKGGKHLNPGMVRDLMGTVQNESAALGLLITLEEATPGMRELASHSGFYRSPASDKEYPIIQIRTVKQLLEGQDFDLPPGRIPT